MLDKIGAALASLEGWRIRRTLAVWGGLAFGNLVGYWFTHVGWVTRVTWCALSLAWLAISYWATGYAKPQRRHRRRTDRDQVHTPRVMPPGPSLIEEVYTALRNLKYPDAEARRAIHGLRGVDLVDFDTAFRAAMRQLQTLSRAPV